MEYFQFYFLVMGTHIFVMQDKKRRNKIMKKYQELSSLVLYRSLLLLPHDEERRDKGTLCYTLNMTKESIIGLINNKHPLLSNNGSIYRVYYYDHTKLPKCIKSNRIKNSGLTISDARKQRIVNYTMMADMSDIIKTPMDITSQAGRNVLYDLEPMVELLSKQDKLKKAFIVERLRTYFDTLSGVMGSGIHGYTSTCILVDLDEFEQYKLKEYHVLSNLMMLLKRSDKVISQFSYNIIFLFFTKNGYFVFDMSKDLEKSNYTKMMNLLKKMRPNIVNFIENGLKVEENKDIQTFVANKAITALNSVEHDSVQYNIARSMKLNMTGDDNISPDSILSPNSSVITSISDKIDNVEDLSNDTSLTDEEQDIFKDESLKKEFEKAITDKNTATKTTTVLKRDEMLRDIQKSVKIKTKTIGELLDMKNIPDIPTEYIDIKSVTNDNMKKSKFHNFNKAYMRELYEHDIASVITSMNNCSIPVMVTNVAIEDSSDTLNLKETYTITFEDEKRRRHTVKVNIPKFIDDQFMYINGNKKVIQNQFFSKPVIKTGPDEVQIRTNYNRIFIYRYGTKFSKNSEKFRKLMNESLYNIKVKNGHNVETNKNFLTCLEYDEFAKLYNTITIGKATFVFNAKELESMFNGKYKSTLDSILVGYTSESDSTIAPIFYKRGDENIDDFITLMVSFGTPEMKKSFRGYATGKKFIYTKATIMSKNIPLVVLICFFESLTQVIKKFNDGQVVFSDKKDKGDNYQYIKFADGYLCYPFSNIEACLLFNGFTEVNTAKYTISEMDDTSTYLDILESLYGSSYVAGALINFYDFMIDPITLEILQALDYPTDIVSLIIFANNLLADNDYINDINLSLYRIRRNEIVAAILYKNLARAYARYRATSNNPNPVKISMDPNAVIKEIMALPTVEDYSTLSPMVELHKSGLVSMKGADGMNTDRAYKAEKRAYDDSMMGIVGISTDPGPNCGKIRQLVLEPNIINTRGFMELPGKSDLDKLTDVKLSTGVELLTPLTATHDDPTRAAMSTKQTCHTIPVAGNAPSLVSTGMDQMIHYNTGDDFSVVAKDDGKVVEFDESAGVMVVEYKSDQVKQAIDLTERVVKNGGGGFYLSNKLTPRFKLGQTFKKNDILAYNGNFYKDQGPLGVRLTMGSLIKVAVMSHFSTYEDSTFVTKHMSEMMGTNVVMQKTLILGANANVEYIVQPGDQVIIGDELIRYETSYDEEELDRLLSKVRSDMKEQIVNLGKSQLTTSYSGTVVDVVIYCTVDPDRLSPSLKKIVTKYYAKERKKEKILNKYDPDTKGSVYRMGVIMDKPCDKIKPDEYGKVKGQKVGDGVLIEFYISYHDEISDGDKITQFTANKNTVGYQIPKNFEPYSEYRPYEEISGPVAPSAILQRGTPSVITTGCANKVLIELKRHMYEVMTGQNYDEVLKQKQPYMDPELVITKESVDGSIFDEQFEMFEKVTLFYTSIDDIVTMKMVEHDKDLFFNSLEYAVCWALFSMLKHAISSDDKYRDSLVVGWDDRYNEPILDVVGLDRSIYTRFINDYRDMCCNIYEVEIPRYSIRRNGASYKVTDDFHILVPVSKKTYSLIQLKHHILSRPL